MGHVIPLEGNLATQYVLKHREPLPIDDALNDPRMAPDGGTRDAFDVDPTAVG